MKVIIRLLIEGIDPAFDFGSSKGPHIETTLDVLPVVGGVFYLTPSEQESLKEQYTTGNELVGITDFDGEPLANNFDEFLLECHYVESIHFTYNQTTGERYVLIDLEEKD